MIRHRRLAVRLASMIIGASLVLAPTRALAVGAGEVEFQCTAFFPSFPSEGENGYCGDGVIDGAAQVSASGVFGPSGRPYVVAGLRPTTALFSYSARCVGAGLLPLFWTVDGTAIVDELPAFANGEPTSAHLQVSFRATVMGNDMTIVAQPTFTFLNGGSVTGIGRGLGEVFPILTAGNHCPEGGAMTALVQGELDLELL